MACPSQRGSDPGVILKRHEAEKKRKYLAHCEHQRKHFTPLVFSINGMMGMKCDAARKRVTSLLSTKCMRMYSEPVLAMGLKSLNLIIPDAMLGLGFKALTV
eukprot:scaffold112244_cov39-Attheya_sp.AAC.1